MNEISREIITGLITAPLESLGFSIVKLSIKGANPYFIEILIEKINEEPVSVNDCVLVSKSIDIFLTVGGVDRENYFLEISSAGSERPLVTLKDFERFKDRVIKVKLFKAIENCTNFQGEIVKVVDEDIYLKADNKEVTINFNLIKKANLVLTNEMFKKLLNK